MDMFKLGIFLILIVGSMTVSPCNHGWVLNEKSCYHVSRDSASWIEAMRMCEIHGGTLAHIETPEEQLFINGLIANFKLAHSFWLGGSDWGKETEWVWEPEGVILNYTNWRKGRPDNYRQNEHCLLLDRYYHDTWDDRDCHTAYHYICEIAKQSQDDGNDL